MSQAKEYVLGMQDDELARLGFQHAVWRTFVQEAWRAAGIGPGASVVDVGASPGFATVDLAELVGAQGHVTAVELSARALEALRAQCAARGHSQVQAHTCDLM